ncbi:MAG: hypothetical protein IOC64_14245 [Methylobacterium sp.]|nr:hypothetical protein [Methylobacterium sp.]MCA3619335.1 hypothetical protein [Methylobacterium sp.]
MRFFANPDRRSIKTTMRVGKIQSHFAARFEGASDHAVSEAFYLGDPEGNGIEVYADRPRADWRGDHDGVDMTTGAMGERDSCATRKPRR